MAPSILCIITSPNDANRAHNLTFGLDANITFCDVDKSISRLESLSRTWEVINSQSWDLIYLEGTGIAGGLNAIRSYFKSGQKYIVSSGDPIAGYFKVTAGPFFAILGGLYERLLYSKCAGFIGWTPYLTGMALNLGARRAITIAGVDLQQFYPFAPSEREAARLRLGIKPEELVLGVVGSLNWRKRTGYCYGLELIASLSLTNREDVTVMIVGEGSGLAHLRDLVPKHLQSKVIFTGRLDADDVVTSINVMDVAFVTQSLDCLGNYRLSTKLAEYLGCGVPVAMSPVPGFFDFAVTAGWALPSDPANSVLFHKKCAKWIDQLSKVEITTKASQARQLALTYFDNEIARLKFRDFTTLVLSNGE